jgi:hypothetical protein
MLVKGYLCNKGLITFIINMDIQLGLLYPFETFITL